MEETLKQVGELLLGSIPTVIFLVLLYASYTLVVHRPLVRVLGERRSKTEGAIERAQADIAAAAARTAEYEQRVREARLAAFRSLEARRQEAAKARAATLAEVKVKAQEQVQQARAAIENDREVAQSALAGESGRLAAEIIRTVLQPVAAGESR